MCCTVGQEKNSWNQIIQKKFSWNCIFGSFKLFPSSKIDFWPFLKLQKMEFRQKIFLWNWFLFYFIGFLSTRNHPKMGLRQVEQGFSSFLATFLLYLIIFLFLLLNLPGWSKDLNSLGTYILQHLFVSHFWWIMSKSLCHYMWPKNM